MSTGSGPRNIVLVHGAFVDGSSWRAVYDLLTGDSYHVAVAARHSAQKHAGLGLNWDRASYDGRDCSFR